MMFSKTGTLIARPSSFAISFTGCQGRAFDAGIAIVPHGTILQEISKHTLAEVKIEDAEFFRPLAAIYKKNKVLSPAMKQFIAVLKT